MLSEQTKLRFDREISKFPSEQKISAVMACLAIIQQERGWISDESQEEVAAYLGGEATNKKLLNLNFCLAIFSTVKITKTLFFFG